MTFSSKVGMHSVRSLNHWVWSHGLGLVVAFSWSQEEYRAGYLYIKQYELLKKDGMKARDERQLRIFHQLIEKGGE